MLLKITAVALSLLASTACVSVGGGNEQPRVDLRSVASGTRIAEAYLYEMAAIYQTADPRVSEALSSSALAVGAVADDLEVIIGNGGGAADALGLWESAFSATATLIAFTSSDEDLQVAVRMAGASVRLGFDLIRIAMEREEPIQP